MKTFLSAFALCALIAAAASFALKTAGVELPGEFSLGNLFDGFVISLVSLTFASDYARAHSPRLLVARVAIKSARPLAT